MQVRLNIRNSPLNHMLPETESQLTPPLSLRSESWQLRMRLLSSPTSRWCLPLKKPLILGTGLNIEQTTEVTFATSLDKPPSRAFKGIRARLQILSSVQRFACRTHVNKTIKQRFHNTFTPVTTPTPSHRHITIRICPP